LVNDIKTGKKCTKWTQNVPNGHKIPRYPKSVKYSKWP
jgi:hypothetical protein